MAADCQIKNNGVARSLFETAAQVLARPITEPDNEIGARRLLEWLTSTQGRHIEPVQRVELPDDGHGDLWERLAQRERRQHSSMQAVEQVWRQR